MLLDGSPIMTINNQLCMKPKGGVRERESSQMANMLHICNIFLLMNVRVDAFSMFSSADASKVKINDFK